MRLYRDKAVVLRTQDLGEADRIVTLMSKMHGLIRAVAKGVRRTKSRFGARVEPFAVVDAQFYRGRGLHTVTEVATIAPFGRDVSRDYERYTAACTMAEIVEKVCVEQERDTEQYLLLFGALNSLASGAHRPEAVLTSYILRAMSIAGWRLATRQCAVCGRRGELEAFNVQSGGVVCATCAPPGSARPGEHTRLLLSALLDGEWSAIDAAAPGSLRLAGKYASAYAQWHLERKIRSLDMVRPA